jgi:hypothetical protein
MSLAIRTAYYVVFLSIHADTLVTLILSFESKVLKSSTRPYQPLFSQQQVEHGVWPQLVAVLYQLLCQETWTSIRRWNLVPNVGDPLANRTGI